MADTTHELADLLLAIEAEMRRIGVWEAQPPPPEALRSTQPFSIDTLTCVQWLQWVFVARMKEVLEQGLTLPGQSDILPYAEECLKSVDASRLLSLIRRFDELIKAAAMNR